MPWVKGWALGSELERNGRKWTGVCRVECKGATEEGVQ